MVALCQASTCLRHFACYKLRGMRCLRLRLSSGYIVSQNNSKLKKFQMPTFSIPTIVVTLDSRTRPSKKIVSYLDSLCTSQLVLKCYFTFKSFMHLLIRMKPRSSRVCTSVVFLIKKRDCPKDHEIEHEAWK